MGGVGKTTLVTHVYKEVAKVRFDCAAWVAVSQRFTTAPERTMMLDPLPWRDAWTLFCNVAFRELSCRTCQNHLEKLAVSVLERCRGLPLAIVSVGNRVRLEERP
ncbi:hypothetical protein ACP70R_039156 [Stipagrostis hirtigluma subsp. patula]